MNKILKISKKVKHGIMPHGGSCGYTNALTCGGVPVYAVYKTPHATMKKVDIKIAKEKLCY